MTCATGAGARLPTAGRACCCGWSRWSWPESEHPGCSPPGPRARLPSFPPITSGRRLPDTVDGAAALVSRPGRPHPGGARLACDEVPHPLAAALDRASVSLVPAAGVLGGQAVQDTGRAGLHPSGPASTSRPCSTSTRGCARRDQTDLSAAFPAPDRRARAPSKRHRSHLAAHACRWPTDRGRCTATSPSPAATPRPLAEGGDLGRHRDQRAWVRLGLRSHLDRRARRRRGRQQDQFARWRAIVDAVLDGSVEPGATAGSRRLSPRLAYGGTPLDPAFLPGPRGRHRQRRDAVRRHRPRRCLRRRASCCTRHGAGAGAGDLGRRRRRLPVEEIVAVTDDGWGAR